VKTGRSGVDANTKRLTALRREVRWCNSRRSRGSRSESTEIVFIRSETMMSGSRLSSEDTEYRRLVAEAVHGCNVVQINGVLRSSATRGRSCRHDGPYLRHTVQKGGLEN